LQELSETALIIHPIFTNVPVAERGDAEQAIEEACGLAEAINLDIAEAMQVNIKRMQAGYLFGKGTRENIAKAVEEYKPDIVMVNFTLSLRDIWCKGTNQRGAYSSGACTA